MNLLSQDGSSQGVLTGILMACVENYLAEPCKPTSKNSMQKILDEALASAFLGLASAMASAGKRWQVDEQNPGYLIAAEPPVVIRAPAHLIATIPNFRELSAIKSISESIKYSHDSVICISGSFLTRSIDGENSDLDFCEYSRNCEIENSLPNWKALEFPDVILVNFNSYERLEYYPWDCNKISLLTAALSDMEHGTRKRSFIDFEFITSPKELGITKISKRMMLFDDNWKGAAEELTFPMQEAPIGALDRIPQNMADAKVCGRYIVWLIREMISFRESNQDLKCAKRALSLARFCNLGPATAAFSGILGRAKLPVEERIMELKNLHEVCLSSNLADLAQHVEIAALEVELKLKKLEISGRLMNEAEFRGEVNSNVLQILDYLIRKGLPSLALHDINDTIVAAE